MYRATDPERRLARIRGRARANSQKAVPPQPYLAGTTTVAKCEADWAITAERKDERRRSARVALESEVLVRRLGGFNFNVALKDISTGGCRVEMIEPAVAGDPVIARLPQLEPLGSRVCWAEGKTTGMQFLTTIHPAVFDMLLIRLANGETVEPAAVH